MRDYREIKKRLNRYHKFTFRMPRKGKDFTPQQKAAITRAWESYGGFINGVNKNKKAFINASAAQRKNLQGDFYTTNRGVFVGSGGVKVDGGKVRGSGFNTRIEFTEGKLRYSYFPRPDSVTDFEQWADDLKAKHGADQMSLAIQGNLGFGSGREAKDITGSPPLDDDGEPAREIVTGVYLIFINDKKLKRAKNAKATKVKRKANKRVNKTGKSRGRRKAKST